jgi:hypothetical protein
MSEIRRVEKKGVFVDVFPNVAELKKEAERLENRPNYKGKYDRGRAEFYRLVEFSECIENLTVSDNETSKKVSEIMDRFSDVFIETSKRERQYSVVGRVVVPRAIAGHPLAFSRVKHLKRNNNPITIVYDTLSSGAIDGQTLANLGMWSLAMFKLLSLYRPVDLYLSALMQPKNTPRKTSAAGFLCKVDINSIDLPRLVRLFADEAFHRGFCHRYACHRANAINSLSIKWPWSTWNYHKSQELKALFDDILGKDWHIFGSCYIDDELYLNFKDDPEQWVRNNLERMKNLKND